MDASLWRLLLAAEARVSDHLIRDCCPQCRRADRVAMAVIVAALVALYLLPIVVGWIA